MLNIKIKEKQGQVKAKPKTQSAPPHYLCCKAAGVVVAAVTCCSYLVRGNKTQLAPTLASSANSSGSATGWATKRRNERALLMRLVPVLYFESRKRDQESHSLPVHMTLPLCPSYTCLHILFPHNKHLGCKLFRLFRRVQELHKLQGKEERSSRSSACYYIAVNDYFLCLRINITP